MSEDITSFQDLLATDLLIAFQDVEKAALTFIPLVNSFCIEEGEFACLLFAHFLWGPN